MFRQVHQQFLNCESNLQPVEPHARVLTYRVLIYNDPRKKKTVVLVLFEKKHICVYFNKETQCTICYTL